MTLTLETILAAISLGALFIAFFLRLENRLTKIETKLDLHLSKDAERT